MLNEVRPGIFRLSIYIQPNANKNEIIGPHNGALKIKIKALPIEGRANSELINFLSELCDLPKKQIEILKGDTGRNKIIEISGANLQKLKSDLNID